MNTVKQCWCIESPNDNSVCPTHGTKAVATPSTRKAGDGSLDPLVSLRIPEDDTERFWMRVIRLKEAECPNTGAYLRCSKGQRMTGRSRRWWAVKGEQIVRFTADSIEEAIAKGNARLNASANAPVSHTAESEHRKD